MSEYPYGAAVVAVTITGVTDPVDTYGGLDAAKQYLGASSSPGAEAWMALATDSAKGKRLVDATRFLDALSWSEIDDEDAAVAAAAIVQATQELAGLITVDNETTAAADAGSNIKSLNAKGVSIDFFRPTSALNGTATQLPVTIQRLVGRYLATSDADVDISGASNGTDEDSYFENCDRLSLSRPF